MTPVGIPLLFFLVIKFKNHSWLNSPARLLYLNFEEEWQYFEVYDLLRKLTLTSIMNYVAPPDSSSQCLFLLVVDIIALITLAYSRPYANPKDDFLSSTLISVECIAFLVALIYVSSINESEGYGGSLLLNVLFYIMLLALIVCVPLTLAMKFRAFSQRIDNLINIVQTSIGITFPSLKTFDSKARLREDVQIMTSTVDQLVRQTLHAVENPITTELEDGVYDDNIDMEDFRDEKPSEVELTMQNSNNTTSNFQMSQNKLL